MAVTCCAYFTERMLHPQVLPFVGVVPFTIRTVGHENMRASRRFTNFPDQHCALGFLHTQRLLTYPGDFKFGKNSSRSIWTCLAAAGA